MNDRIKSFGLFIINESNTSIGHTFNTYDYWRILMRILSIIRTIAMFLVGGSIITHEIPALHHYTQNLSSIMSMSAGVFTGFVLGAI
ncbi:DUF808 family protein [Legionella sp.]|uniref:DUF808 family protein n=1 Tax=Legionella sp. TaxID=459 RepID=UPI003D147F46